MCSSVMVCIAAVSLAAPADDSYLPAPTTPIIEPDAADTPLPLRPWQSDRPVSAPASPAPAAPPTAAADPPAKSIAPWPPVAAAAAPPAVKTDSASPGDRKPATAAVQEQAQPWVPLTLALFALLASLGMNLFLGWVTWDTRNRFRALLAERDEPAFEFERQVESS